MSSNNPKVINLLNSSFGIHSHIGYRTPFVLESAMQAGFEPHCLARDSGIGGSNVEQVLPLGDIVPRLLNGIRIYISPGFNHRPIDIALFEKFSKSKLVDILEEDHSITPIVHLWEFAPGLIDICHEYDAKVALEIPIAPSHEAIRLQNEGLRVGPKLDKPHEYEDESINKTDFFLSPSPYVTNILTRIGTAPENIFTNRFGCHLPQNTPSRNKRVEGLTYLFVGGLSRRKGLPTLLEVWSDQEFVDDKLILCGRPRQDIRKKIRQMDYDNIITPGHIAVDPYYKEADVFVFPTLMEGCSKAALEAMSWGLPIITTTHSGAPIDDGNNGIIIPVGDKEALLDAMVTVKEEPEERLRMGRESRKTAENNSWAAYGNKISEVYRKISERNL
jgi:glycosyltransferase involved in cell wall biosynthesis